MFDEKCHELAENFLKDHPHLENPENTTALAQHIQDAIEDFLDDLEKELDEGTDEADDIETEAVQPAPPKPKP